MKTQVNKINVALLSCASIIVFLFFSCQPSSTDSKVDNGIVGRWEYAKTVNPDGTEVYDMIGMEHYYADGTMIYFIMRLNPFSLDSLPESRDEYIAALVETDGGIGAYKFDPENNMLRIILDVSTDTAYIGKPIEPNCEIFGDTIVFWKKYHFVRVKE